MLTSMALFDCLVFSGAESPDACLQSAGADAGRVKARELAKSFVPGWVARGVSDRLHFQE